MQDEISKLRKLMDDRGISIECAAVNIGVSGRTICRWLRRDVTPTRLGYKAIQEYLDRQRVGGGK